MPQLLLPFLSSEITYINGRVTVYQKEDEWTYFLGDYPIYSHKADDLRLFRLTIAQLIESGACRQADIIEAFGVSKSSVIRAQNKYRDGGSEAFFNTKSGSKKCGTVLTPKVLERAQKLLDEGLTRKETAEKINVKYDTLRKAINDGRLQELNSTRKTTSKSIRTVVDAAEGHRLGTACTRVAERTFAAFGVCQGAPVRFEPCIDVPKGGVLSSLPALLVNGLINGSDKFLGRVKGYYTTFHILLLLAFMALCRIKTVEKIRGESAGEFGKLLGLDRIPEVRCLRKKMNDLSAGDTAEKWALHLSQHWMESDSKSAGTLYIDGHVRLYHGGLTKLPRRYVSRERLCLRGTTDYWVNDAIGQPFFVVEKTVDPGLLKTLRLDIVPRLLRDIPAQPTKKELESDPYLCRFILVFDREGYSPAFFQEMWQKHRISCMTYHKHPGEDWPESWFEEFDVPMPNGETVSMKLAEMGSLVGTGSNAMWMREIRKLTKSGHQTSLISTEYQLDHTQLGARMFSRWCQENFFRYMMEHFAIDLLQEYGTQQLPDTEKVINPAWRNLNRSRASVQSKLRYRRARFAEMTMHPAPEKNVGKYEKWLSKKSELFEQIEQYEQELTEVKAKLKTIKKHVAWESLNEKDKFFQLLPGRKRLMDTVKMIAYRAETSMASLLKDDTTDMAAARRLMQDLYVTEADIIPQPDNGRLLVRVHNASRPYANKKINQLFKYLNEAEMHYPGTQLRLQYELSSNDIGEEKSDVKVS
jgi:transposase/regulator of replication initiation timing